jgi:hypothetical protein
MKASRFVMKATQLGHFLPRRRRNRSLPLRPPGTAEGSRTESCASRTPVSIATQARQDWQIAAGGRTAAQDGNGYLSRHRRLGRLLSRPVSRASTSRVGRSSRGVSIEGVGRWRRRRRPVVDLH